MINTIFGVFGAIIVIALMIIAHEGGHFFVGRACGLTIDEFAIGFGPKLVKWRRKETNFSIRLLPIGGFCLFRGEDENSSDPKAFNNQEPWKRFLTILAGATSNLLCALILAIVFLSVYGDTIPVIHEVSKDTPAYEYGLQKGDIIREYDGEKIDFAIEMSFAISRQRDDNVLNLVLDRNGEEIILDIPKEYNQESDKYLAGFTFEQQPIKFGFFESVGLSFKWLMLIIKEMLGYLGGFFTGTSSTADIGGIVSAVDIVSQAFFISFGIVLELAALLSINLAVINLLPLPALDGGRLVFIVIEKIRKKPISREIEGTVHAIGMFLLLGLMVLLTYKDIVRIFFGG
jgi:regulator of sigma E protease